MRQAFRVLMFGMLAMGLVVSNAGATDLEPLQISEDAAQDHPTWAGIESSATPQVFDLKGVHIAETRDTVDFIWEYWDIPDGSGGLFVGNYSYFDFALDDNDGVTDPVLFQLQVQPTWPFGLGVHVHCRIPTPFFSTCTGAGPGGGFLASNCTNTSNVISCQVVPGSLVTVTVDDIANTIRAKVRRLDLRDADNNFIGTDGSLLTEVQIFSGIASCQGVVLLLRSNCDQADMNVNVDEETGGYILGTPR